MKTAFGTLLAAAAFAGSALCQVTLPPHASTYNGYTRGYNFTAANNFIINQLELPLDAFQAGDTMSVLVRLNGNVAFFSTGTPGPTVPCSVIVNPGDVVDVVGNWTPPAPGTFTAHNSYGNSAPYATSILGVPTTLLRVGVQNDIGNPAWAVNTQWLAPTSSAQIGRIFIYAVPPSGTFVNFTSDVTGGASPLTVNFTDTTYTSDPGGIVGWAWDFDGDAIIDSTLQNPTFVYTNCGTYDVTLTTVDATFGPNTTTKTAYIRTDAIQANFAEQVIGPFTVLFTDTSNMPATSWAWDLDGDSVVDSTSQNAAWVYPNANPVNVTLTVTRLCGTPSTFTKAIVPVQSISHNVLPNNGLSSGASVYFDLDVTNPAGINLTSMDVAPSIANTAFTVEMFVKPGSYVGSTGTAADWVSAGIGSSAGGASTAAASANVAFPQALYLPPGQYGVKLWYVGVGPRYQTGSAQTTVTNGDLSLTVGASRGSTVADPWAGSDITPRHWSGTLYYSSHNLAGLAGFGRTAPGCAGTLGVPHVSSNLPQLGTTMTVNVNNLAQSFGIMITGFAGTVTDLTAFGAPGCSVRTSVDATSLLLGAGNTANWNFNVPNVPAFSGLILFHQVLSIDPAANGLGVVMSDAAASQIGS